MTLKKSQLRILAFMAQTDQGIVRNWYGPSKSGYLRHHIVGYEGRVTRADCEELRRLKLVMHREAVQVCDFSTWYITEAGRQLVSQSDALIS